MTVTAILCIFCGAVTNSEGLDQEIAEIFSYSRVIGESRANAIADAVLNRADAVERLCLHRYGELD